MKTARIIINKKCNRSCHYCCNEQDNTVVDGAVPFTHIGIMHQFEAAVITGGEPMLFPHLVKSFVQQIKALKNVPIYMYSATFTKYTEEILQFLDGITFTVHQEANVKDVLGFEKIQELAAAYPGKQFRLVVHDECPLPLPIVPNVWSRVTFFHHKDFCPLPTNETLFEYAM